MRISLDFSEGACSIPTQALRRLRNASGTALRLLLVLASDAAARENFDAEADRIAALLKCDRAQLNSALAFWCGAGVAELEEHSEAAPAALPVRGAAAAAQDEPGTPEKTERSAVGKTAEASIEPAIEPAAAKPTKPARKSKLMRAAELPEYTTDELNRLLEGDVGSVSLVDEAQRRIGRMFNPREVSVLVGLKNYLELTDEYLYILLEHCARVGKTSMRYVETVAFGMYDDGINDADALRDRLAERELYSSFEGRFKAMVGGRGRRLTAKESRFVNRWCLEMKYDFEMIELAYDVTVDNCHEYNPAYMNGVLERWYAAGISTPEAVRADADAHKSRKDSRDGASFNTDEFFEAALKRSYSDS